MTTIAQRFLDNRIESPFDARVASALTLSIDLTKVAERVVFEEPLYSVFCEMIREGQLTPEMVARSVKRTSDLMWIEWAKDTDLTAQDAQVSFGVLLTRNAGDKLSWRFTVVGILSEQRLSEKPSVMLVFDADEPPYFEISKGFPIVLKWILGEGVGVSGLNLPQHLEKWRTIAQIVFSTCLFGLFLLQQPKIITTMPVVYGPKLQKKRLESKKKPLIEHHRVHMRFGVLGSHVGVIAKHGAGHSNPALLATGRRKYHRVLGHFRMYGRDTPLERVVWIEQYFRGDVALGVLFHEKHLKQVAKVT